MPLHPPTTTLDPEGRLLAVKRAASPIDIERLQHEAALLEALDHPGVVRFVSFHAGGGRAELVTENPGGHSLDAMEPLPPERVAGIVASVADTIADLHDLGVVHGRVEPAHIVVGADGGPRLCSFGAAGATGEVPIPSSDPWSPFADPANPPGAPLSPASDVFALGAIVKALVEDGGVEPIPERRFRLARGDTPWSGYESRALLTLADRATADEPSERPTARAFAASIWATVPEARLGPGADIGVFDRLRPPRDRERARPRRPQTVAAGWPTRLGLAAVAVVGLLLIAFGVASVAGGARPTLGSTTTLPAVSAAPPATDMPTCSPVTADLVGDIDGDGCPDEAAVADGVLSVAGARYRVGMPGDEIILGDWDCDGRATPAVIRPSTGAVFLFASWAEPAADLTETPIAQRAPPGRPRADDTDGDGCSALVVDTPAGSTERVWPVEANPGGNP